MTASSTAATAWSAITTGSNTNTLTIGTAGSLAPTGTGTITANLASGTAIAQTGVDINTSFQVTALHLASPLGTSQGGTGASSLAAANIALTTATLAQFAATSSAQLAGVISDETGTGLLMFSTNPLMPSYVDVTEIAAPANPGVGNERWFANSSTHVMSCLTSAGGSCAPSGGSGTVTTSGSPAANQVALFSSGTAITGTATDSTTTHALFATATVPAFRAIVAGDIPTLNQNTSGTAANLSGTPALPNGTTATTQTVGDNTTKLATTAFVLANAGGAPAWSSITAPSGSLALSMGANTSIFSTTTALSQMFGWKNVTAAVVGTSQGSPILVNCGRAFHGSADVEDCMTFSELPGNGNDAAITFNIGHTGTSTGTVTTQFPGPIAAGSSGGVGGTLSLPEGTAPSASASNDLCYADSTSHFIKCSNNNGSFLTLPYETGTMTSGDLVSVNATTNLIQDASVVAANVVTAASNFTTGQVVQAAGANKALISATGHGIALPLTCGDTSASGTAQVCNTSPTFTPVSGDCINYTTTTANTGAGLTWNVNSLGAKSVEKWLSSTTLVAGDIPANKTITSCYNGTSWDVMTIGNAPSGGSGSSVSVNGGATVTSPNLNAATPAAVTGATNVTWQQSTNSVSAYTVPTANVTAINNCGFVAPIGTCWALGLSANLATQFSATNVPQVMQFVLPYSTQVTKISYNLGTLGTVAATCDVGLYSAGTLLTHTGSFACGTGGSTGVATASVTTVQTPAGIYYLAWCAGQASGTLPKFEGVAYANSIGQGLPQTTGETGIAGTTNGTCTAGVLPGSLGTVTNNTGGNGFAAYFGP